MRRVAVVGAGKAGTAAAVEASARGAAVEVFEAEPLPEAGGLSRFLGSLEGSVSWGTRVISVNGARAVSTSRSRGHYDAVVVSTGTKKRVRRFPGSSKPGVFLTGDAGPDETPPGDRVVVQGEGPEALALAAGLVIGGSKVTLVTGSPIGLRRLCAEGAGALAGIASQHSLGLARGQVAAALGSSRVQVVLLSTRELLPCDLLLALPSTVPNPPLLEASVGERGAILVDSSQASDTPGLFAAGGSSAYSPGAFASGTPAGSAPSPPRVAGANAAGRHAHLTSPPPESFEFFGVPVSVAGLTHDEATWAGLDASRTVTGEGPEVCSVLYERRSLRLLGLQLVGGSPGSHAAVALASAQPQDVRALAELDQVQSTDISLVAEAARQCIRRSA
ncbi:MAG: FAD-dependent oxidoreductase [archaeon]|nr:MAG: FAD-dependent oxidoreductase [archaeon]